VARTADKSEPACVRRFIVPRPFAADELRQEKRFFEFSSEGDLDRPFALRGSAGAELKTHIAEFPHLDCRRADHSGHPLPAHSGIAAHPVPAFAVSQNRGTPSTHTRRPRLPRPLSSQRPARPACWLMRRQTSACELFSLLEPRRFRPESVVTSHSPATRPTVSTPPSR